MLATSFSRSRGRSLLAQLGLAALMVPASIQVACKSGGAAGGDAAGAGHVHGQSTSTVSVDLERYKVPLFDEDFALGAQHPLVTVVVFSNYACDPCRRTWLELKSLVEHFGDDLRVVHRSVGIAGYVANDAAIEAAYAAGSQGKFWEMHWRLFDHPNDLSRPAFRAHAEVLKLDVQKFLDDLDDGVHSARRLRDKRRQAELGVSAGPMSFVNGSLLLGFQSGEVWHAIIDHEIAKARDLLATGVKRTELYTASQKGAMDGPIIMPTGERDLRKKQREAKATEQPEVVWKTPEGGVRYAIEDRGTPGIGPRDAAVVVTEFIDFECPFCRRGNSGVFAELRKRYPRDVRWAVRHFPLEAHRSARPAALASVAAHAQAKFWPFHERLFSSPDQFGQRTFARYAEELGLDAPRFLADYSGENAAKVVDADIRLGYELGITGTPAVFVNGFFVDGVRSLETYAAIVDRELDAAKKLKASGTPAAEIHAKLMAEGLPREAFPNFGRALPKGVLAQ